MSSNTKSGVTLIAEAGTAHLGDIERAKRLIDAAAAAEADYIKFQWVIADEIVHPNAGAITLHGKPVRIWERFRALERPPEFYAALKRETEQRGLRFLCSPFGVKSAAGLRALGVEAVKIASPELNHYPLLAAVADLPLFLSTGVSTLGDIERCVQFLRSGSAQPPWPAVATESPDIALLHCITAYPAPEEEYNLRLLPLLGKLFGTRVGVSDHSAHPYLVPLLAVSCGAEIIEKHITLARSGDGLDDPLALEPRGFAQMVARVRTVERQTPDTIQATLAEEFGPQRVEQVLGSGTKKLAASEAACYYTTNRSIVALTDLQAGHRLSRNSFASLRAEQQRRPGLPPHFAEHILGSRLKNSVEAGTGITWADLL
ncbi:MAG: N-acetylneuraminate synthase family protein [Spirochaetota bacterium]